MGIIIKKSELRKGRLEKRTIKNDWRYEKWWRDKQKIRWVLKNVRKWYN